MINVAEVVADPDFTRTFTVRRPTSTFANEGVHTSTYTDSTLTGIVQPASPKEMELLPEGHRVGDVIAVWSTLEMRAGNADTIEADVIVVDGKSYKVLRCEPWADAGYWKVLAEGFVP